MHSIYIAGRVNIDTIVELDGVLLRGRKHGGRLFSRAIGGTGANVAIAMARFNRGFKLKLIASIGTDYADYIVAALASEGIDVSGISLYSEPSGEAYIFIDKDCEATIVTIPNVNVRPPDPGRYMVVDSVDAVVLGNTVRETALNLIGVARGRNAAIFLDPGMSWFNVDDLNSLGEECFIIPNRYEFKELFGIDVDRYLQNPDILNTKCTIIIKLGSDGAAAIDRKAGTIVRASPLKLEGLGISPRTTAGCGDVFTGIFAARYLENRSLLDALLYASVAAGLKRSRVVSSDAPTRSEIERAVELAERRNLISITVREF
ncbi:MAG: PfkB family carbohydrate kinase [Ignisphaera sp.]|nr:PfkB family carbohydrate kinase [Ignisphaera sp.]MCX8167647.1 PfkB family carbohydrate kinase [Ignisphaera sp.]MDW8085638.1 PfkB family carbohydrate kinase [Ignisphaera sp.]